MAISDLKGIIDAIIKTNGRQEITGASLNEVLTQMVNELDVASELSNKVDKELGKGLSTNDFTTSEKEKLAGLENYDDTTLKEQLTELSAEIGKKQNTITDLETIRSGAAKGATALQSVPATYATKTYVDEAIAAEIDNALTEEY